MTYNWCQTFRRFESGHPDHGGVICFSGEDLADHGSRDIGEAEIATLASPARPGRCSGRVRPHHLAGQLEHSFVDAEEEVAPAVGQDHGRDPAIDGAQEAGREARIPAAVPDDPEALVLIDNASEEKWRRVTWDECQR